MRLLITLPLLFIYVSTCIAQQVSISGIVSSVSEDSGLPGVTIAVFEADTNKLLTHTITDERGSYTVKVPSGAYYIKADHLGYSPFTSKTINATASKINMNITLNEDITELKEVTVLKKKRLITLTGDKMVVDIDKSGLGDGNNRLETLSKVPGIRLDKDENILFRGNGNLQILINGKPSLLTGEALKQYLKTLSGNDVKSVEIIANPSARYDASGTGGILNLQLKRGFHSGTTGSVNASVGYAEFIKNSYGFTLYNNTRKWNINSALYYGYNESVNHRKVVQTIEEPTQKTTLEQFNDWFPVSNRFNSKLGVAYHLSANKTIGTSWNYSSYRSDEETVGRTNEFYDGIYERYTLLNTEQAIHNKILTGTIYYGYASDSLDNKWDIQLNYAGYDNREGRITTNRFLNADTDTLYKTDEIIRVSNPTRYNILSFKNDFEIQLSKAVSLETGVKYSYVDNKYTIAIEEKNNMGIFTTNHHQSNKLHYKESIAALYGIVNYTHKNWNFQAGLRSEYIHYDATSITNGKSNKDHYLSLFPSFSINRSFNDNQYKLSYSRRITRPRYLYLNPFFEYVDTYNIRIGNPNLLPQFTDAFELSWVNKHTTSISVYARFTRDEMDRVLDYDEATRITTIFQDNIASSEYFGLSLSTVIEPAEWWEIQCYADASYNHAKSDIPDYRYDKSGGSWYATLNQSFTFDKNWNLSWNSFYASGGTFGNSKSKPSYDMSFGLKKDFSGAGLSLRIKADNIFKTSRWRSITVQDHVTTRWTNRWETRKFNLSLTYNFGKGKKKRIKPADLSDEQNRL